MSLEENIEAFRHWAIQLGCPPQAIPTEDALKSIFKSRQRESFCNLMSRVQPLQTVRQVRQNILVSQISQIKEDAVSSKARSLLPKELQTYLHVKDLKAKKAETLSRLEERRRDYETLAASVKTKNINCISLKDKCRTQQVRVDLLSLKAEALAKDIAREEQNQKLIAASMPVQWTMHNSSETAAMETVRKALKELDAFYSFCDTNHSSQALSDAKEELWKKMRRLFSQTPNFLLFGAILRLKEEQLQYVVTLNRPCLDHSSSTNPRSLSSSSGGAAAKHPPSPFEQREMMAKVELLALIGKYVEARKERQVLEERFTAAYEPFVEALQRKVALFNGGAHHDEDEVDELISEYIVQYNLRNFNRSQNEFLTQQIETLSADIKLDAKLLDDHELLLGSIKQTYGDISASINRIQYEMQQLAQIKEKILYTKKMSAQMLSELRPTLGADMQPPPAPMTAVKSNFVAAKLHVNDVSIFSGESFELGSDNVFCSTKLDLDSTGASLNNTTLKRSLNATIAGSGEATLQPTGSAMASGEGPHPLAPHSLELAAFAELPLARLAGASMEWSWHFAPNPLICETQELSSTVQLAPGLLLTPLGALQEVRNRILWADLIARHSNDLKFDLDLDLILVDQNDLRLRQRRQREQLEELVDRIRATSSNTNHTLQKIAKLYQFVLENPLRHFIPPGRTFNNLTYVDYEAEFSMYHRMASVKRA